MNFLKLSFTILLVIFYSTLFAQNPPNLDVEGNVTTTNLVSQGFEGTMGSFTSSGDAGWTFTSTDSYWGSSSATTSLSTSGTASLERVVTIPEGSSGEVSFRYKITGSSNSYATFGIQGSSTSYLNSDGTWHKASLTIPEGTQTIVISLSVYYSAIASMYVDVFEVDEISNYAVKIQDGNEGSGKVLTSDENGHATWKSISDALGASNGDGSIEIYNAPGDAIYIHEANDYGIYIYNSGYDGAYISSSDSDGIDIYNSGDNGVEVSSSETDGLHSSYNDDDGIDIEDSGDNGIEIDDSGNNGIEINNSGVDGVYIGTSNYDGVRTTYNGNHGFYSGNNGDHGFYSISNDDDGVHSYDNDSHGLYSSSNGLDGVNSVYNTDDGIDIENSGNNGAEISVSGIDGIYVFNNGDDGVSSANNADDGISVTNNGGDGIYSSGNGGHAGWFSGALYGTTVSKGSGTFKIDHPLDPENKYMYHSFVESPDMMNIYNGNVTLDSNGEAEVEMEEWFDALNKEFRYQLTCIGGYSDVYIAEEVNGNSFRIAGGTSGLKVSWQLTGIRKDPHANANRVEVEVDKPAEYQGYYLDAEAYGLPFEKSIDYVKTKDDRAQEEKQIAEDKAEKQNERKEDLREEEANADRKEAHKAKYKSGNKDEEERKHERKDRPHQEKSSIPGMPR